MKSLNCFAKIFSVAPSRFIFQNGGEKPTESIPPVEPEQEKPVSHPPTTFQDRLEEVFSKGTVRPEQIATLLESQAYLHRVDLFYLSNRLDATYDNVHQLASIALNIFPEESPFAASFYRVACGISSSKDEERLSSRSREVLVLAEMYKKYPTLKTGPKKDQLSRQISAVIEFPGNPKAQELFVKVLEGLATREEWEEWASNRPQWTEKASARKRIGRGSPYPEQEWLSPEERH